MPDRERADVDPGVFHFEGFTADVRQAFKPHFADVVRRAGRRRGVARAAGAAIVTVGLAAGGGTTIALTGSGGPGPVNPTPSAGAGPWVTQPPAPGSRLPAPQPNYAEVAPGNYDPTERNSPFTGLWTAMIAGDLDHLYLEYQNCKGSDCTRMIATSADRGRTWRKLKMPAGLVTAPGGTSMAAAHGKTLVARNSLGRNPDSPATYWTSTDGGVNWRQPTVREVDALPVDWSLLPENNSLAAFDPATGDMVRTGSEASGLVEGKKALSPITVPISAGIWRLAVEFAPMPSPLPTSFDLDSWLVVMVSRDGGRTWDTHRLPETIAGEEGGAGGLDDVRLATADGETVYATEKRGDSVRVHVSTDGAATWRAGALLDLDGPALSVLPTADGALIIESPTATFRSTDQAQTFTKVGPSLGNRGYALPGGGYAIPTNNNEVSAWLSPDGANWTYVPRPDLP
ncbi:sialidase family protein [Plantactinospora soyae]|uniref:Exo-alpha-sialidase n=1 Tax=Plantactinospora soyae TaxID=1544732 RepID=A0A927M8W6_9ACTN|nr:sialidase family protein [Plantactinospora soyae]MBE1486625.1 hypothetical protein [Plantactinospora soyae]